MKIVLITSLPAPYRVLQFEEIAKKIENDFKVYFCLKKISHRKWEMQNLNFDYEFLHDNSMNLGNKILIFNQDIIKQLNSDKPDIIIASGFFPTNILAFIYAKFKKKKFIVFTDSWLHSVNKLSFLHRLIRKFIIKRSDTFICVGIKGKEYLETYGASLDKIFISPLSIDNIYYSKFIKNNQDKEFDLIFSGQFVERKLPYFVVNVVKRIYEKGYKVKLLLIGSGKLKDDILHKLKRLKIDFTYSGFIQQKELPKCYSNAKILLFPSRDDPWGLVANEACAAGTPVITCKNTGVAGDLILDNKNGYILPLEVGIWADQIINLLNNKEELKRLSNNASNMVKKCSIENATNGVIEAIYKAYYEERK